MLILSDELFIGKGCHKATYRHPKDSTQCIKVLITHTLEAREQLKRELALNQHLQEKHTNLRGLSRYLGTCDTNLGIGYVFELVLDFDQTISKGLDFYLKDASFVRENYQRLLDDLLILKLRMSQQGIIPMDILPYNLLYRQIEKRQGEFIIIDEIGTAAFIPLEKYFRLFAKARIHRKWNRFASFLSSHFEDPQIKQLAIDLAK